MFSNLCYDELYEVSAGETYKDYYKSGVEDGAYLAKVVKGAAIYTVAKAVESGINLIASAGKVISFL